MPTAVAQSLPLADELHRLQAAIEQARGLELRGLRRDLAWAQRDQATALAADPRARAQAEALAAEGDADAEAALARARSVEAPPPSRNPWWEDPIVSLPVVSLDPLVDALAGLRRDGASFDEAWPVALELCGLTHGPLGSALASTVRAWQAAYLREPPPRGYELRSWPEPEHRPPPLAARARRSMNTMAR